MKTGLSLQEMAAELERQKSQKRDFLAPSSELEMTAEIAPEIHDESETAHLQMRVNGHGSFDLTNTAHEQLSSRLGIPRKYYDRMSQYAPHLLVDNVNHWMKDQPEKRMVRTLDGKMRAFLSSRYRPLDNFELAETVLPVLIGNGVRIESSALTETRMYIKAVTDKITTEVRKGDVIQAGIVISNSEVGWGSVKVEPMIFRLVCLNGMIAPDYSMNKYHVGRNQGDSDLATEFFRDETRRQDDKAFWMKVRDVVSGSFRQDVFEKITRKLIESTEKEIGGAPEKVIEVFTDKFQLAETEGSLILRHLIKGGDLTQYGLMNAVTRASQDVKEYDRATELERLGGQVIELSKSDWEQVANAEAN
ncbi:MAG: DUF932 domain-containing protein [Acidobacteria bacterium]|nr:MAG: DUF932 domain-containing protein [Acidobacteriota bacterium]